MKHWHTHVIVSPLIAIGDIKRRLLFGKVRTQLLPPALDALDHKRPGIGVNANADPAVIGGDIVDAIRGDLAKRQLKVVRTYSKRKAGSLRIKTLLEMPNQANDRTALAFKRHEISSAIPSETSKRVVRLSVPSRYRRENRSLLRGPMCQRPVLTPTKQCCKTSARIETWPAEPINGPFSTDKGGGRAVADECVILNRSM